MRLHAIAILLVASSCFAQGLRSPAFVAAATKPAAGGAEVLPVTANLVAWWKSSTLAEGAVTSWTDSSGNGWTLKQDGTGLATNIAAQLNGLPGLYFDGVDSTLTNLLFTCSGDKVSLFCVFRPRSAVKGVIVEYSPNYNSASAWILADDGGGDVKFFSSHSDGAGLFSSILRLWSDDTWHYISQISDRSLASAEVDAYDNGTQYDGGRSTDDNMTGNWGANLGLFVGMRNSSAGPAQFTLCEMIIYSDAKGTTDRQSIENFLKTKYGL